MSCRSIADILRRMGEVSPSDIPAQSGIEPQPLEATPEPQLPEIQSTHAPWVRPISDYERRETTIVEGQRYG
jgi:hypothetical protein